MASSSPTDRSIIKVRLQADASVEEMIMNATDSSRLSARRREISLHAERYNELAGRCRMGLLAEIRPGNGFYWLVKGEQREGPYCPRCYEQDDATTRLVLLNNLRYCRRCGEVFNLDGSPTSVDVR
jgi:hypothetical protein